MILAKWMIKLLYFMLGISIVNIWCKIIFQVFGLFLVFVYNLTLTFYSFWKETETLHMQNFLWNILFFTQIHQNILFHVSSCNIVSLKQLTIINGLLKIPSCHHLASQYRRYLNIWLQKQNKGCFQVGVTRS